MRIILASNSPRRKELMDLINIKYEIVSSNTEETLDKGLPVEEQSKKIAYHKAKSIYDKTTGDRIVIGADTLVIKDGKLFGKPRNEKEAKEMITQIRNAKHQVITSLAILIQKEDEYKEYLDTDIANVYVSEISGKEIEEYINTYDVYDKAGAYAIQSSFCKFIEKIEGNYTTILGLPVSKLYQIIKEYSD
jgi:septum formation protein